MQRRIQAVEEFCSRLGSFDPEKGSLTHYALRALRVNQNEALIDEVYAPGRGETQSTTVENEDGELTEQDIPARPKQEDRMLQEAYTSQMTAMILNFWGLFGGRRGSGEWQRYFPMWYSEKTKYLQQSGCAWENTADVLRALDFEYLDYFLDQSFADGAPRSWERFAAADLKEAVTKSGSGERFCFTWSKDGWLPAKVPRWFLVESGRAEKEPGDSTITTQRSNYLRELAALFQKDGLQETSDPQKLQR